jgi:hypothetical protein
LAFENHVCYDQKAKCCTHSVGPKKEHGVPSVFSSVKMQSLCQQKSGAETPHVLLGNE